MSEPTSSDQGSITNLSTGEIVAEYGPSGLKWMEEHIPCRKDNLFVITALEDQTDGLNQKSIKFEVISRGPIRADLVHAIKDAHFRGQVVPLELGKTLIDVLQP